MKRNYIIGGVAGLALIVVLVTVFSQGEDKSEDILATVRKGDFDITVSVSGELDAKNSIKITGPARLRAARIWNVKIQSILAEGTLVEKGQPVAQLDPSELSERISTKLTDLEQAESQYTQTKLDTALTLREARDDLLNLGFNVEQKKIELEQSAYEPPAQIKKVKMEMEKAKRDLIQATENYDIKRDKAVAEMREAAAKLQSVRSEVEFLNELKREFVILAPEEGMLIYEREYGGQKKREGSSVSAWDPTVATLPDLTNMQSRTYVNEVDIRKIEKGQSVEIGLDAFPDKKLTGKVVSVANVGEQRPNADAKVFEVMIDVNETDESLRPAMTTSNKILADRVKDALFVPLEALHNQGDSLSFVYLKDGLGFVKKEIVIGKTNDNFAQISVGLTEGQQVSLSTPGGMDEAPVKELSDNERSVAMREQPARKPSEDS